MWGFWGDNPPFSPVFPARNSRIVLPQRTPGVESPQRTQWKVVLSPMERDGFFLEDPLHNPRRRLWEGTPLFSTRFENRARCRAPKERSYAENW